MLKRLSSILENAIKLKFGNKFLLVFPVFLLLQVVPAFNQNINVRDFGARGDGKADDTYAIQRAINEAASKKKVLNFNAGTYLVTNISIKCNMKGIAGKTRIKKINTRESDVYVFCNVRNQNALDITNMIFDGSVAGTDVKPLQGAIPLFLYSCKDIKIYHCSFLNTPMAGLRIESSVNIQVDQCTMENLNGNFGDGIYIEGSENVRVSNTKANDYTRIGFVVERNSRNVRFENCRASNGHDASILHGGTEYNAGFWAELAADVHFINCTAVHNSSNGFVISSGVAPELLPVSKVAVFSIIGCKSYKNPVAFQLASSGNPVNIKVQNCRAEYAEQGFVGHARFKNDRFEFTNCTVSLLEPDKDAVNVAGFMWESGITSGTESPVFVYKNCITRYLGKLPINKLYDRNTNNADLSTYSGGNADIFIDNMRNNTPSRKPIIKAIKGRPRMEIKNTTPDLRYMIKKEGVIIR